MYTSIVRGRTHVAIRIYSTETRHGWANVRSRCKYPAVAALRFTVRVVAWKWLDFIGPSLPQASITNKLKKWRKERERGGGLGGRGSKKPVETRNCNNSYLKRSFYDRLRYRSKQPRRWQLKLDQGVNLQLHFLYGGKWNFRTWQR